MTPPQRTPRHLIRKWIKWMTKGKAPGNSKISMDLLKPCLPFDECIRLATIPSSWKKALLVPIPKKANPVGIAEHRPINLTEHLRKVFEHCIHL